MDVSKIIESKISNYFSRKAARYACGISSLSLLIQKAESNEKISVALYKDGKFLIWASLEEILNLSFIELMATNENKVSRILMDNVTKYEQEFNGNAQIAIHSNLEYFALSNYKRQKQITINDIL